MERSSLRKETIKYAIYFSNENRYNLLGMSERKLGMVRDYASCMSFTEVAKKYEVYYNRIKKTVINLLKRHKKRD